MKVLNLLCSRGHGFEGWFGSEEDYQAQLERGLVECPLCADKGITRLPSAPRLNLSGLREEPTTPAPVVQPPAAATPEQASVEALWLSAIRHVMAHTEDVGERFAEEARRIHYGESEHRGIRGRTSQEEAVALAEEGIEVMALPIPAALKGPTQ
ncbi:MAG TPA: DUF1178 family protein [Methylibium sp.]